MFQQHPPKSQQPNSMDNQHNTMAGIGDVCFFIRVILNN